MSDFQFFLDQALKKVELVPPKSEENYDDYDVLEDVRTQIVNIRTELGITQSSLASRSGLTQANVSKIEKGVSSPTIETLLKLSKGLGKRLVIRFEEPEEVSNYD